MRVIPLTIEDGGFMHKILTEMLQRAIHSKTDPNPHANNVTLSYWKQRLFVASMKVVAMTILAQHPTCRTPSCISNIETHRYKYYP